MVHGGQADVFVYPAIAGDVMRIQQLVVVGAGQLRAANVGVRVSRQPSGRIGIVGDVVKEAMPGAHGVGQTDRSSPVTFDQLSDVISCPGDAVSTVTDANQHLRHAARPADEVAIVIG
ncbi:hypothetical protein D9M71_512220 [compost metagenome]